MSNGSSTITFKVAGNDVLSYIDRVKQKSDEMTNKMIQDAQKQSSAAKDQLRVVEDQIKALERKNKIEMESARRVAVESRDSARTSNQNDYDTRAASVQDKYASGKMNRNAHDSELSRLDKQFATKNDIADKDMRDQLNLVREQERQSTLQTKLMRDNIETVKMTSNAQVLQMKKGDDDVVKELDANAQPMEKMAHDIALERYDKEGKDKKPEPEEEPKSKQESTFGAFIKAMALEKGLGLMAQMPGAKNELDFVKPMASMIGMSIGGLMGNLMDGLEGIKVLGTGAGQTNFAALGTQLGEKAGEFFGTALERAYKGRDELTTANFRLQALTGQNLGIDSIGGKNGLGGTGMSSVMANLEKYGEDFKQTSELQYRIATSKGQGTALGRDAENVLALQQALAVNQETSTSLMELQRSSRADSRDVMKLVSGVLQSGSGKGGMFAGDRAFLNEFLVHNFSALQKQLLQTNNTVGSAETMSILKMFNNVGGMFSARDPRSGGLISQIQNSLSNPGSDVAKATSYMILRKLHPEMSVADLEGERQKGLDSPGYVQGILKYIKGLGGSESAQRFNIEGYLGLNNAAAKRIYDNQDAILNGKMQMGDLTGGTGEYSEDSIRKTGQAQTSKYTKSSAEIENAFVKDVATAVGLVGTKMEGLFAGMIDQLKQKITDMIMGSTSSKPVQNVPKKGKVYGNGFQGDVKTQMYVHP